MDVNGWGTGIRVLLGLHSLASSMPRTSVSSSVSRIGLSRAMWSFNVSPSRQIACKRYGFGEHLVLHHYGTHSKLLALYLIHHR